MSGTVTVGSGPDTLALLVSDGSGEPADFTIDVDGTQIGGIQTVGNDVTEQTIDVLGNYPAGTTHTVSLVFDAGGTLELDGATIDGITTLASSEVTNSTTAPLEFTFTAAGETDPFNTPMIGADGIIGSELTIPSGTAGQSISEDIAGYSLSLPSITPEVIGGNGALTKNT